MVEGCAVASALVFRALLPPHPALSLGERENRPPLRGESNALDRAGDRCSIAECTVPAGATPDLSKTQDVGSPIRRGEAQQWQFDSWGRRAAMSAPVKRAQPTPMDWRMQRFRRLTAGDAAARRPLPHIW